MKTQWLEWRRHRVRVAVVGAAAESREIRHQLDKLLTKAVSRERPGVRVTVTVRVVQDGSVHIHIPASGSDKREETCVDKSGLEPGLGTHDCHPGTWITKVEDCELKANLGYKISSGTICR